MNFEIGDLVRIKEEYAPVTEFGKPSMLGWIGLVLSYRGMGGSTNQHTEWFIQWAHNSNPSTEYGYYLEVI